MYRIVGSDRDQLDFQSPYHIALNVETRPEPHLGRGRIEVVSAALNLREPLWIAEVATKVWYPFNSIWVNRPLVPQSEPAPPAPKPVPPCVLSFRPSPTDPFGYGHITAGDGVVLSWQVQTFGAKDTNISLDAWTYANGQIWRIDHLPFNSSLTLQPNVQTMYSLWADTPSAGGASDMKNLWVFVDPRALGTGSTGSSNPPVGNWFYFKMDNGDPDSVARCFTASIFDKDEPTAQADIEAQNPGYTAQPIDYAQYVDTLGTCGVF